MDPAEDGDGGSMFPTGKLVDDLDVPGVGTFKATMINSGIPTIFLDAERWATPAPNCRKTSTATPPRWRASRPSAPMARCAWA